MNRTLFVFCILLLFNFSCTDKEEPIENEANETVTDIDGNVYNITSLRGVKWLLQNLRTSHYRDGTVIPEIKDKLEWNKNTSGAYSWYGNINSADKGFGKLYNWEAATCCDICPDGFRLPTQEDFIKVIDNIGYFFCDEMDCPPYLFWISQEGLSEGKRSFTGDFFNSKELYTGFWIDNNSNENDAIIYELEGPSYWKVLRQTIAHKSSGLSIKCVEDR